MLTRSTEAALEASIKNAVAEIRTAFDQGMLHHLHFRVNVEGRTNSDLRVEFQFFFSAGVHSDWVTSHSARVALEETLRRHNWAKRNTAKLLPWQQFAPEVDKDDL
jgi:hypothetical protein